VFDFLAKPLEEGGEAMVTVSLKRENAKYPLVVEMERYNKIKDAGWWILISNPKTSELLCVKKISFKDKIRKDIQIDLPKSFEDSPRIDIHLMSDSYIGIDQVRVFKFADAKKK
jgi:hypothetical protein